MKPIEWRGPTLSAVRAFPEIPRRRTGYELFRVQQGLNPSDWKPLRNSEILNLRSEVRIGIDEGLPRSCGIRCDFLALMFKRKLTSFVSTLPTGKLAELDAALLYALQLK